MDAAGYLKTVDTAVASNTKLEQSSLGVGEAMQISANKSVNASLRATEALKAQVAGYRQLAASAQESAVVRERAALLANRAEGRLNSQLGLTATLAGTSRGAQTAEKDLGKFTRGALAGSGAAVGLGRSLAFASGGFLAVAVGASFIKDAILGAERLARAQDSLDVAIEKTGGNVGKLGPLYAATAKRAQQFGIDQADATTSLARATVLTGDAGKAQRAYQEALLISKATGKDFNAVLIATSKGQEGVTTSLKRYGILIATGTPGQEQYQQVFARFAGQARANTTEGEKFTAALHNTEAIIGTALLPTFERLTTDVTDWLTKMSESGRLQRDVNEAVGIGGTVFHDLGDAVKVVDKVTGSFANTLKFLFAVFLGREIFKAVLAVDKLAASWFGVADAATAASTAESGAIGLATGAGAAGGAAAGRGGGGLPFIIPAGSSKVVQNVGKFTGAEEAAGAAAGARLGGLAFAGAAIFGASADQFPGPAKVRFVTRQNGQVFAVYTYRGKTYSKQVFSIPGPPVITPGLRNIGRGGSVAPSFLPTFPGTTVGGRGARSGAAPFGSATPLAVYASYTQTITEQLAVAQAALTKTTKDDVEAAKRIIARIKRLIANGHLEGTSLVQALQDEAAQQGVLNNARQQAAQQAAKIAAAKQAAASSYTTPIDLQLAEARSQLTKSTGDDIAVEKQILAAAKAAIASGKKNKQGQLAALQVELQAQQALQSLGTQNATTFTQPLKLQLALAKAQATGGDQTKILLREKAALERALKSSKGNIEKQIDIYNQITAINQQLGADANAAFGQYRQASLAAETAGLGLTKTQRKALEARLSQRGPGGTTPGSGVGAGGFIIGPDGRPIQVHHHRRPHHGQNQGGTDGGSRKLQATFNIRIYLDGRDVTRSVTIRQQKTRDRNPGQRRGPHAGKQTA
jgi:hypothetical protein